MIDNIIHREFVDDANNINILWTSMETPNFRNFIQKSCGNVTIVDSDQTFFGICPIDIVICNSRLVHLKKCIDAARFFHCPLILIDHEIKSPIINKVVNNFPLDPVCTIALNEKIFNSWNKQHDQILDYNISDQKNLNEWNHIIRKLIKNTVICK